MPGSRVPNLNGRYVLSEALGQGRYKCVRLALDTLLERRVAIATLRPDAATREDVLREARLAARLGDQPHLVTVYDVIEGEDGLHVVSPFLAGGSLAAVLAEKGPRCAEIRSPGGLVRLALHLTRALEALHDRGLAHGDLTPGNVLFDGEGNAYVTDFGFSAALPVVDAGATTGAEFFGTLRYLAPERAWGGAPTASADVYSLGCVLHEVATGMPPFGDRSPHELLRLRSEEAPPRVSSWNESVPEVLSDLIGATLGIAADGRPSCADLRAALEGLARSGLARARSASTERESRGPLELIQREGELCEIAASVERMRSGESVVLLVGGEPGIGKSRLLREVALRAEAAGAACALGHVRPDTAAPFQPFLDAFLPLVPRIAELPADEARAFRGFLRLDRGVESDRSTIRFDTSDRRGMFVGLLRALTRLARTRPIAILLDDLQWADPDSVDLFEFLVRASRDASQDEPTPILIAAVHRVPSEDGPLAAALARLQSEAGISSLSPPPLDEDGIYGLLVALGVRRPASRLVREIRETTLGNPLFVLEVVDSLRRRGVLETRNGWTTTRAPNDIDLPRSLVGAIADRAKTVSQACRRLLTIGSFIGDRFELRQLRAVAGESMEALLDLLEEAVAADLLVEEIEAFRFAHPLVRQVFYRRSSHARRRRTHAQIAGRLEQIHSGDLAAAVPEIAHHLLRAGAAADPENVLRFATAAAQQAQAAFAWNEAADLYAAAIDAAAKTGRLSSAARAELHRRAAVALRFASDAGLSIAQFDQAIAAFEAAGDRQGRAEALEGKLATQVALGGLSYGQRSEVEPVEQALAELDESETSLRARLLGTIALAHWAAQETEEARRVSDQALSLAQKNGDAGLASDIRTQIALSELQRMKLRSALASWQSAREDARRAGDPVREEGALQRIPLVLHLLGDIDEAERVVHEASRLNRLVHSPTNLSLTLANRAMFSALRAEADQAHQYASECAEIMRRTGYGWSGMLALPAVACAHALRANEEEAKRAIDKILEPGFVFDDPSLFAESMSRYHHLIHAYSGHGIPPTACADLAPFDAAADGLDFAFITPLCVEVEIAWFAGADTLSPAADRALERAHLQGMIFSTAWPLLIPRVRGIAATLEGRWDDAERSFASAVEIADERRVTPERARSRLDWATMLLTRTDSPLDRAHSLLRESVSLFREAGMVGFVRRATSVAESAGLSL